MGIVVVVAVVVVVSFFCRFRRCSEIDVLVDAVVDCFLRLLVARMGLTMVLLFFGVSRLGMLDAEFADCARVVTILDTMQQDQGRQRQRGEEEEGKFKISILLQLDLFATFRSFVLVTCLMYCV